MRMPDLRLQKRLAAEILGVGVTRIYIDPRHVDEVAEAITKDDVRSLINMGYIERRPPSTPSRGRKRKLMIKKAKGKRKGHGSRKGRAGSRRDLERSWVYRVRKQRAYIRELYRSGKLDKKTYRELYLKIKGGVFPSLSSLKNFLTKKV